MEAKNVEKPSQINTAVNLLWASLAIGFVKSIMDMQQLGSQASPAFTNFILISVIAVMALFIVFISKGKNWARITLLVLFILGSLPSIPLILGEFIRSPVLGAFSLIQIVLQVVAMYLVFTKPGAMWFKKDEKFESNRKHESDSKELNQQISPEESLESKMENNNNSGEENKLLEQGCSKEAIDYLKNQIHIYSHMQKYKKAEK